MLIIILIVLFYRLCLSLGWDSDGDLLGAICANSSIVSLWDANTSKKCTIETGLRDTLSCLLWAKNTPTLAVTTTRGNVVIYNHSTAKYVFSCFCSIYKFNLIQNFIIR